MSRLEVLDTKSLVENSDSISELQSPRSRSSPSSVGNELELENSCNFSGAVPKQQRNNSDLLETDDVEYLQQKLTHLKLRLDEAAKTIQAERE